METSMDAFQDARRQTAEDLKDWDLARRGSVNRLVKKEKLNEREFWSDTRLLLAEALESRLYELVIGVVIMFNAGLIIYETDSRAAEKEFTTWQRVINVTFLICYTGDVGLRFYVFRLGFFVSKWNCLDLFVVCSDLLSEALVMVIGDIPSFAVLRICRIFRLLRFVHVLLLFRELHIMLTGFVSAMRAMVWASFMLVMLVTLWSIIAVEVLHPINMRIAETGYYGDCERCKRAFSSVLSSNLTFLQQVIAGDSWGRVSIPIIEEEPSAAVLLFAVLITVNLGLLNLILTVIVDVAHSAREEDELRRLAEKSREFDSAKKKLLKLCEELDEDGSGELSYEELMHGIQNNPRFSATMALLDISPEDMNIMFGMLDEDGSGSITYKEFVEQLHKLKSQDTHTMLIFIRGFLKDVRGKVIDQLAITRDQINVRTVELVKDVKKVLYGSLPMESTLQVSIDGARGLRTEDSTGRSDPYCVCELVGKPDSKLTTEMVEDSLDPDWDFQDTISGYAPGDLLQFKVFVKDALGDEYCLGKAILATEQIIKSGIGFDGQLELEHGGEHTAFLKVRVTSADLMSSYRSDKTPDCMSYKGTSLCGIEGKLQQLSQRLEDELAQLIPSNGFQYTDQLLPKSFIKLEQHTNGDSEQLRQVAAGAVGEQAVELQDSIPASVQCSAPHISVVGGDLNRLAERLERDFAELRRDVVGKVDEQITFLRGWKFVAFPPDDFDPDKAAGEGLVASTQTPESQYAQSGKGAEGKAQPDAPSCSRI